MPTVTKRAAMAAEAAMGTLPPMPPLPPFLVNKRSQQIPAAPIQRFGPAEVVQIAGQVADQQPAVRQAPRPVVEPGLERSWALPRLDAPVPDLDLFIDLQHAGHLEDKARHRERHLQRRARARVEVRRIPHEGEFLLLGIPQRQMPRGLRPWEAAAHRYGPRYLTPHGPER